MIRRAIVAVALVTLGVIGGHTINNDSLTCPDGFKLTPTVAGDVLTCEDYAKYDREVSP